MLQTNYYETTKLNNKDKLRYIIIHKFDGCNIVDTFNFLSRFIHFMKNEYFIETKFMWGTLYKKNNHVEHPKTHVKWIYDDQSIIIKYIILV